MLSEPWVVFSVDFVYYQWKFSTAWVRLPANVPCRLILPPQPHPSAGSPRHYARPGASSLPKVWTSTLVMAWSNDQHSCMQIRVMTWEESFGVATSIGTISKISQSQLPIRRWARPSCSPIIYLIDFLGLRIAITGTFPLAWRAYFIDLGGMAWMNMAQTEILTVQQCIIEELAREFLWDHIVHRVASLSLDYHKSATTYSDGSAKSNISWHFYKIWTVSTYQHSM